MVLDWYFGPQIEITSLAIINGAYVLRKCRQSVRIHQVLIDKYNGRTGWQRLFQGP